MSIFFGVILIITGMYILYMLSSKQIEKTRKTFLRPLTKHIKFTRFFVFLLFFIAAGCFVSAYGPSIGFVSWWLFATPLSLGLILYFNDSKSRDSKKASKTTP